MKKDLIEEMRSNGRLRLSFWESLTHYMIVFALLVPFIVTAFHFLRYYITDFNYGARTPLEMFLISVTFALLGILSYYIQYKRLQFRIIETSLSREKLKDLINKTADELDWTPFIVSKDLYVAKTNPKWWTGSWGEQITILFDKDRLMINSICDPEQITSVASMGRNKKNVDRLIKNIKD